MRGRAAAADGIVVAVMEARGDDARLARHQRLELRRGVTCQIVPDNLFTDTHVQIPYELVRP